MTRIDRWNRSSEWPLTGAAVLFLVVDAVPIIQPELPLALARLCSVITWVTWAVFALDYLIRVILVDHRLRYIRRHGTPGRDAVDVGGVAILGAVTATLAAWIVEHVRVTEEAQTDTLGDEIAALRRQVAELSQALDVRQDDSGRGPAYPRSRGVNP